MFGTDVRGTQRLGFVVSGQQGPLGIRRERGGNVRTTALLDLFLQLGPESFGIRAGLLQHTPHHVILERGVEEVLARQVQATPLHRLLGRPLQKLARSVGEELGYIHLLCLPPGSHTATARPSGLFVEEPVKEVVEEATASKRRTSEGSASAADPRLRSVDLT